MSDDFDPNTSFKRDIAHVFDTVNAYFVLKSLSFKEYHSNLYWILHTILRQDLWDILILSKQVIFALFFVLIFFLTSIINRVLAIEDLQLYAKGWIIKILNNKIIRQSKIDWTHPRYLVNWLFNSDIHMILSLSRDTLFNVGNLEPFRLYACFYWR